MKRKLFRVAAIPGSLGVLLEGQLRYMNSHYEVVAIASKEKSLKYITENEGVRTIGVDINRRISPWNDLKSLLTLYQIFKKEQPFIVHSITPKAGLLSMSAAYFAGVPHRIHTFTGLVFPTATGLMKPLLIFFDKITCRCATVIFPEGKGVKKDLENFGITKKPLRIIANGNVNGIDLDYYDPTSLDAEFNSKLRKKLKIPEANFVFLFVGRIGKDKGINELVASYSQLQKTHKNINLLLVGPYEKELDPLLPETELAIAENKSIISLGWKDNVKPYFSIGNVFVLPSYREGFPNTVLQAGAMGKYSIVTDINGCNEIIEHGKNGLVIPVKNQEALYAAMKNCFENRNDFEKPIVEVRALIEAKYNRILVWEKTLEAYQSLDK